jgi:hypothetical protein
MGTEHAMRSVVAILLLALVAAGCADRGTQQRRPAVALVVRDAPHGWCADEYRMEPDAEGKRTMTLLSPDGDANVIASTEPLSFGIGTREYAEGQGQLLEQEFPKFEELGEERSPAFGRGITRTFTWTPEDGEPVWQVQGYRAVSGIGYVATGTTYADASVAARRELERAVESVRFVRPKDATEPVACKDITT